MKFKLIVPVFPILLAMFVMASSDAKAVDIGVGVNIGGGHHYHRSGVVEYRTSDPVYTTWYPETTTSYVYTPSYYDTTYVAPSTYVYTTPEPSYSVWYGSGRSGRGGWYGRRDDHGRYDDHHDGHRR